MGSCGTMISPWIRRSHHRTVRYRITGVGRRVSGLMVPPAQSNGEAKAPGCAAWSSVRWPGGGDLSGLRKEEGSGAVLTPPVHICALPWAPSMARGLAGHQASRGGFGYGNPQPWAANYRSLGFD